MEREREKQHPAKQQLYGHLLPISKTIPVWRTRHAEDCWRSKDELISDVLLWTPTHGRACIGRPARTYLHQLCADVWFHLEAMDDRNGWGEKESGKTALTDWLDDTHTHTHTLTYTYTHIYMCVCVCVCMYVCACVCIIKSRG